MRILEQSLAWFARAPADRRDPAGGELIDWTPTYLWGRRGMRHS
ncbi:MAG: hypothetical protein ABIQ59_14085 [Nocardioidaceae bacterium]